MPLIEIDHLTKTLSGHTLLDDVCIGIEDGAFVVLLGANGAGKTTLIKCLTGLYRADHGSIRVAGMEWNKANDHKIKRINKSDKEFLSMTYNEYYERIKALGTKLLILGLKDEKIAIIDKNSYILILTLNHLEIQNYFH